MRSLRLALLVTFSAALMLAQALAQSSVPPQTVRDTPSKPVTGSAVVAGIVVSDEATTVPVRRARVTLRPDLTSNGWSATTDDEGRFVLRGVTAGRHTLEVSKPAWLPTSYGATRPGRPGTAIVIGDGQRIENITLRMSRAGVITGTVFDRTGQPVPGVGISTLRYSFSQVTGERSLGRPSQGASVTTDDQGNYRAYGLPPGEYVVVATLRSGPAFALMDLRRIADGEVDRVLAGGSPASAQAAAPLVGFAPVYFPGTADASRAATLTLGLAEERAGINLTLDPVPTAQIEVVPNLNADVNPASLQVYLLSSSPVAEGATGMLTGRRGPDGHVTFAGVTPGAYTVVARAASAAAELTGGGATRPLTLYATADIVADGTNLSVPIDLRPGMTIKGRLAFLGDSPFVPRDAGAVTVHLMPARSGSALTVPSARVDSAGAFEFAGVPAGRFRLAYSRSGGLDGWSLRSIATGSRPVEDYLIDIQPGQDVIDLVLNFTDRPSELGGRLETASGRAAPDFFIVAFSTDRAFWVPLSTRVRQVRPATDGRFAMRGLPSGEYFLAALTDVEPGEWYDPRFLAAVVPAAVKVTVRDGQQTVQDLRIK